MRAFVGLSLLSCLLVVEAGSIFSIGFPEVAARGDVPTLRRRVLDGENINQRDFPLGLTPLMNAATRGKAGAVRFLLDEGADTSITTSWCNSDGSFSFTAKGAHLTALDLTELERARRMQEAAGKGQSWKKQHPDHVDSTLTGLSECVDLLKRAQLGKSIE